MSKNNTKSIYQIIGLVLLLLVAVLGEVNAQKPNQLSCGNFRTQTQGGWGSRASGGNPGAYRDANFTAAFPSGLTIGCSTGFTIKFNTAAAIQDFLPQGGTPSALAANYVMGGAGNPVQNLGNVFAGQVLALSLSVGFDLYDANFGGSTTNLKDLILKSGTYQCVDDSKVKTFTIASTFNGWTVAKLLEEANKALGGCSTPYSIAELNSAVDAVNNAFVDGTKDCGKDFLQCPPVPKPVRPILECVKPAGNGLYIAVFGYLNENATNVLIPVGADNKLTPSTQNSLLPTTFLPGRQVAAFEIPFDGSNLVWTLKGPDGSIRTSTANANSKACPINVNCGDLVGKDGKAENWLDKVVLTAKSIGDANFTSTPVHFSTDADWKPNSAGVGVMKASEGGSPNFLREINYVASENASEVLRIDFGADYATKQISGADVLLSRFYTQENGKKEQGYWVAKDGSGNVVGQGSFTATAPLVGNNPGHYNLTIRTCEPFRYLEFSAGPYADINARVEQADDSDYAVRELTVVCEPVCDTDLAITKTCPTGEIQTDDEFWYTLQVSNLGKVDATNITVTDVLPSNVQFISADNGGVESPTGTVKWTLASLAKGASITLKVKVKAITAGTGIVNNATVVFENPKDTNNENNQASCSIDIKQRPANVSITKNCVESVKQGENITYTLTVTNTGNKTEIVEVKDFLPSGVTFVSASHGGVHSAGVVTWTGISIGVGAGNAVTLTVEVTATHVGSQKNTAKVITAKTNLSQQTEASCTTDVRVRKTNISITKTASKSSVKVGENFTYTIKVKNEGEIDAVNTIVSDDLPAEVEYVSASPTPTTQIGNSLTWNLGTVAPSTTKTITVTVKAITAKDGVKNTATVTTDTEETTTDDNSDDEVVDIKDVCPAPADICDTQEAFAIKVTAFNQGKRHDGNNVAVSRSNPNNALGMPQNDDNQASPINYVSLGFGGSIDLELATPVYNWNKTGVPVVAKYAQVPNEISFGDLIVVETSYGRSGTNCGPNQDIRYPERARFFGRECPEQPWVLLGEGCRVSFVDVANIEQAGQKYVKYLRIVDISDKSLFTSVDDGYDVDGVIACPATVDAIIRNGSYDGRKISRGRSESGGFSFSLDYFNREPNALVESADVAMIAYPNPSNGRLTIDLTSATENDVVEIHVYSTLGELMTVRQMNLSIGGNKTELDISNYANGMYIIKTVAKSGASYDHIKIIKE